MGGSFEVVDDQSTCTKGLNRDNYLWPHFVSKYPNHSSCCLAANLDTGFMLTKRLERHYRGFHPIQKHPKMTSKLQHLSALAEYVNSGWSAYDSSFAFPFAQARSSSEYLSLHNFRSSSQKASGMGTRFCKKTYSRISPVI